MQSCPVSKKGLANLRDLKGLEELAITKAAFTDADMDFITGLTNLQSVSLWGTQITDQGLQKLTALPKLQCISVGQSGVTNAGIQELMKTFPKLSWSRYRDDFIAAGLTISISTLGMWRSGCMME